MSYQPVPGGWCMGSKPFRAEMLQHIEVQRGKWHASDWMPDTGWWILDAEGLQHNLLSCQRLRIGAPLLPDLWNAREGSGREEPLRIPMTSKMRIEPPEALCHVMNRGGPERTSPNAFASSEALALV